MIAGLRRWFHCAFSLRMMFAVVTIVGVWLGWQMKWIRERREFLATEERLFAAYDDRFNTKYSPIVDAPWPFGLFGEQGLQNCCLYVNGSDENHLTSDDSAKLKRARQLFPECDFDVAHIERDSDGSASGWFSSPGKIRQ